MTAAPHMQVVELAASRCYDAPPMPGLYAWYYAPKWESLGPSALITVLSRLVDPPARVGVRASMRYGLTYTADSPMKVVYGQQDAPIDEVIAEAVSGDVGAALPALLQSMIPEYGRPIYIGIADNLFSRVYKQHYSDLVRFWDPDSSATYFLKRNPAAQVQEVMDALSEQHSFALEARVRGIRPADLRVYVTPFSEELAARLSDGGKKLSDEWLRPIEQLFQLLSDPICGRR